ncbi:hypothetical protein [Phascolarctobacterium sp.]
MYMRPDRADLLDIIKSYRGYGSFLEYCNRVKDRFGYWNDKQLHPLPVYTEKTLEDQTLERVRELGPKRILWSGGVDSTFIVCAYVKAGVPCSIVCDWQSIHDGAMFYSWLQKQDIELLHFESICEAWRFPELVHGDVADQLFSPDEKRRTILPEDVTFFDNLSGMPEGARLCEQVIAYGKLLDKPVDTNAHIIRLLNFGNMYLHGRDELYYTIFPEHKMISFFDTAEFNNIAFTQYWERTILDDKPEMHRFICDVTQDERMMWGVYRSPTKIEPRLPQTRENFRIWEDE